ncbi:hypothetical protein HMPREF3038_00417 [Akkermansia sp. KLE1797]|nr:hypothetical protein HMPREF3038_00417 [Akkermansia sp. KLE1797]KZA04380.1 hypothetical protein HMPREF1326_02048 [Akkermansia sp. KLE1605]
MRYLMQDRRPDFMGNFQIGRIKLTPMNQQSLLHGTFTDIICR